MRFDGFQIVEAGKSGFLGISGYNDYRISSDAKNKIELFV